MSSNALSEKFLWLHWPHNPHITFISSLHHTATALLCHDILCRSSIDIFLSIWYLCTHLNYSPSSCDWGLRWSVKTDAGIVTLTTVSVTERCLHTLAPAPQQQLPSPDLAPAPVTTERKPALTLGCSHNHYTFNIRKDNLFLINSLYMSSLFIIPLYPIQDCMKWIIFNILRLD